MAKLKVKNLSAKQQKFVDEYLVDLNATQAAIRAGYSAKTAESQGARLLRNVKVQKAVQEAKGKRSERTQIDADYVLRRHAEIDQLDILDIINDDMTAIKPLKEWPKVWRISINGIDISEMLEYKDGDKDIAGFVKKLKWPDKIRNLELLGKHVDVQAYRERIEGSLSAKHNIMMVPGCADISEWEKSAQQQQDQALKG